MVKYSSKEKTVCSGVGVSSLPGTTGARQEAGLLEILAELILHWRKILLSTATITAAGVALSFVLPVRYTATVKILPPRQTGSEAAMFAAERASSAVSSLSGGASGALSLLKNPDELYIGILKSRPVADALISKFELAKEKPGADMTAVRTRLASNTKVSSESRSGFIVISVTDKSKDRAAQIANAYVDQLRVLTQTLAVSEAAQRRSFYELQLKHTKEDLVEATYAFQNIQQENGMIQPDAQGKALITSLADLKAKQAAAQVELEALRLYATDRNPSVKLAESQVSSLAEQVRKFEANPTRSFTAMSMKQVPDASLAYLRAQHELTYQQTLYDLLIKQYDVARLDESKQATVIQVIEPAILPDRKSSPARMLITVLFAVFGGLTSCGYYVLKATLRNTQCSEWLVQLKRAAVSASGPQRAS